jgi:hypothetical protein
VSCPRLRVRRLVGLPFGVIGPSQPAVRAPRFNMYRGRIDSVDDVVALATRVHAVAGWNAEIYADAAALGPHVDRLSRMAAPLSIDHLGMTQAVCGCCSILPRRA